MRSDAGYVERWPAAVFALGLLMAIGSGVAWRASQVEEASAGQALSAAGRHAARVAQRQQAVVRLQGELEHLRAQGVFRRVPRRRWIDWLEGLPSALPDARVRWSMGAWQPLPAPAAGGMSSKVMLKAGVQHEGEFVRLVAALREAAPGPIAIDACSLRPVTHEVAAEGVTRHFAAECTVTAYAFDEPRLP